LHAPGCSGRVGWWAGTVVAAVSLLTFACHTEPASQIPFSPEPQPQPAAARPERPPVPDPNPPPAPAPVAARPPPEPPRAVAPEGTVALLSPTPDPKAESHAIISETQHQITGSNLGAAELICLGWGKPPGPGRLVPVLSPIRVSAAQPLTTQRFDVGIFVPDGGAAELRAVLRDHLQTKFGITVRRDARDVNALALRAPSGRLTGPGAGRRPAGAALGTNMLELSGDDVVLLAEGIEQGMERPVVDETGLREAYDLRLAIDPERRPRLDLTEVRAALRDQLGLDLVAQRRQIEFFVVERAARP
jgi:hypothetical protein